DTYTIVAQTPLKDITGIRLEVLTDKGLPAQGPGRAPGGNFVLSEFKVEFAKPQDKQAKPVKLIRPQATFSQDGFPIAYAIDNNPATGWAIAPQIGKNQTAVFEAEQKFGFAEGTKIIITMSQNFPGKEHNIGKFRISVTDSRAPVLLQGTTPENIT